MSPFDLVNAIASSTDIGSDDLPRIEAHIRDWQDINATVAPDAFMSAWAEALRLVVRNGDPELAYPIIRRHIDAATGDGPIAQADRLLALMGLCITALRRTYGNRQDATAVRTDIREIADAVLEASSDLFGGNTFSWGLDVVGKTAVALSAKALDLAPIVTVTAGISMPSTLAAWRLYGDPEKAGDLVERNAVSTSVFMPETYEAESARL